MAEDPRPERAASAAGRPGGIVRVAAECGLDWTGPRRAWDAWFVGRHAWVHNKGRDRLPATCNDVTIAHAQAELGSGPDATAGDPGAAGPSAVAAGGPGHRHLIRVIATPGEPCQQAAGAPPRAGGGGLMATATSMKWTGPPGTRSPEETSRLTAGGTTDA